MSSVKLEVYHRSCVYLRSYFVWENSNMEPELKEFRNENLISVDWYFPEGYECHAPP